MRNNSKVEIAIQRLKDKHILVTGGAGFIGSNLVEFLLSHSIRVSVLDNLSTGKRTNLDEFEGNSLFSFIEGDITDFNTCLNALDGIDLISHQAALGSVPRSIEFPHNTHNVNATGYLNMLHAAKEKGIKRMVYASSSSVYGNSTQSPKKIGEEGELLSPYAVTKRLNEEYAMVYNKLHDMETVGLRYFNIFGTKQDPNGVYAAAIPKFISKMLKGEEVIINGDGEQTRDFTYVLNAVNANVLGLSTTNSETFGNAYNIACGQYFSLNDVIQVIKDNLIERGVYNDATVIVNGPARKGDVLDSLADITNTAAHLEYEDPILFDEGIRKLCSIFEK
ncbi:MAG: NAD-dependent epimerase/dehydratase family protein [Crocinitomicaceae bacterium]|nr:NAD-dependent epimerase/dehydratase family protein [Crocinitomicaceae bacterium]